MGGSVANRTDIQWPGSDLGLFLELIFKTDKVLPIFVAENWFI